MGLARLIPLFLQKSIFSTANFGSIAVKNIFFAIGLTRLDFILPENRIFLTCWNTKRSSKTRFSGRRPLSFNETRKS
jgi:hypothetical protein